MGLGAQIQAALTALPPADKRDFAKTWDAIGAILDGISSPVGAVVPFAGTAAPAGWLICNGAAVSRSTYAALFAIIGTTYGPGNGTTTFNLPDLRGVFVRGSGSHGTLVDAAGNPFTATLGSYSNDKMQGHRHMSPGLFHSNLATTAETSLYVQNDGGSAQRVGVTGTNYQAYRFQTDNPRSDGTNGNPRTGAETNPANLALNHIIRF